MTKIDLTSTGSERGHGFYKRADACPRKATLRSLEPEYDGPPSDKAAVGVALHALLARFHHPNRNARIGLKTVQFDYVCDGEPALGWEARTYEAERLFAHYRERYTATSLGTPKHTEFPFACSGRHAVHIFGVPKFTGQVDLISKVARTHIRTIQRFGLDLTKPGIGYYVIDHKTMWRSPISGALENHVQFALYVMAVESVLKIKTRGTIVNCIIAGNPPKFRLVYVPPPSQPQRVWISHWLQSVDARLKADPMAPGLGACFTFNQPCRYLHRCSTGQFEE